MAQLLIGSFPALSLADARRMNRLDLDAKTWTHTQGKTGDVSVTPLSAPADEMRKWLDRWAEHVAGIAAPRAKPGRASRYRA